jgi:hypothetical protein
MRLSNLRRARRKSQTRLYVSWLWSLGRQSSGRLQVFTVRPNGGYSRTELPMSKVLAVRLASSLLPWHYSRNTRQQPYCRMSDFSQSSRNDCGQEITIGEGASRPKQLAKWIVDPSTADKASEPESPQQPRRPLDLVPVYATNSVACSLRQGPPRIDDAGNEADNDCVYWRCFASSGMASSLAD